ncbi:MAG: acetyl-CoA carboxylase, biotin carboxyl carrier protein [Rhodobacteraceae bacterium]|nr:acetyl-CoA carboxylase, biotin carboxyl carrier protein [Paracoccaceae bacterium]
MAKQDSKLELISKLMDLFKEKELGEFEVEFKEGDTSLIKLRMAHYSSGYQLPNIAPLPAPSPEVHNPSPQLDETQSEKSGLVSSEMVGTVYLKQSPEAPTPFVQIGQSVKEGDTILIIEAMKTMNFIGAPHAGTVRKVMVDDGEPVQFGSELMIID